MEGALLEKSLNPYNHEGRIQRLEQQLKMVLRSQGNSGNGGNGGLGVPLGPGSPPTQIPVPLAVSQSSAIVSVGVYNDTSSLSLDEAAVPLPVGAIGYVLRITPSTGAAYIVNGPRWPATASPVAFPVPPAGTCTVEAALQNAYGVGPYSSPFSFTATAPTTSTMASRPLQYTLATLPAAASMPWRVVFVTDATLGNQMQFSNGTAWISIA